MTTLGQAAVAALASGVANPGDHVFTSDLSVDEAVLLHQTSFEPRSLVMGCSIFRLAIGATSRVPLIGGGSQEMTDISRAMYQARANAMNRMIDQARAAGGDGVVGVRLDARIEGHFAEFTALGTAVRFRPDVEQEMRGLFFTSDLSGQDLHLLVRAGYRPVGLVMGTCINQVPMRGPIAALRTAFKNTELTTFTDALYDARELAMTRMQDEARSLGADGIVGVKLHERPHHWGGHSIEFLALGTAVRELPRGHRRLEPRMVVPLADVHVLTAPSALGGTSAGGEFGSGGGAGEGGAPAAP